MSQEEFSSLMETVPAEDHLDAVLLVTATGGLLAGWTRAGLRQDVMAIMSVTMTASVDTLMEELCGNRTRQVLVEAGAQRFLVSRLENGQLLVLLAPSTVSRTRLVGSARTLVRRLASLTANGKTRRHPVPAAP